MSMRWSLILMAFAVAPAVAQTGGVDVYFNGAKVTKGIRSADFEKVNLKFDEHGNVHIDAPGYEIQTPAAAAPPPAAPPSQRFWLILNAASAGQYKVVIKANGQPVVEVPAGSQQYVVELTGKVYAGANAVEVTFLPAVGAPAVPPGTEAVSVMVGEGNQAADGTLTINKVLGTVKQPTGRNSAEAQNISFQL